MSNQIPVGFSEEFTTEVRLLLQQQDSRFRDAVTVKSFRGKDAKAVEQIGAVTAVLRTTRHGDTPILNTPHDARWVYPSDYEWADLIDPQDELRAIASFQSSYVQNAAAAMRRAIDDVVINAIFSTTTKTGEDAGTTTSWATFVSANSGHQIADGSVGMTVAKLRAAKKAFLAAEVDIDMDPLFVAIGAEQHDDLLGETLAVSLDYNTRPVLVDGRIRSFMGFNFIDSQRLLLEDSTVRRCPAWSRTGVLLGIWNDVTGRVSERDDKSYSTQVYAKCTVGATRLEEKKVVEIECAE